MGKVLTDELLGKYPSELTDIETFGTKVVGTTFREPSHLALVDNGDYVLIDPEVGNEYDKFACRVVHDTTGNMIGYIPKVSQNGTELSKLVWENSVQKGHLYVARVQKTGGGAKQTGFNLEVKHLIPRGSNGTVSQ